MATLEFLTRKLQSSDAEERREAAVDLGRTGREAIPLLLRTLSDADWRVRKTAVEALIALGGDDVIQGLIQCLSAHDNAGARNSAIEALVHLGGGAVDALLSVLETPDVDVRKFIVDILGDIGDTRAVPALIGKLDDPDENIRVAAAESLGKIRDRRAVEPLIACLTRYDQSWLDYAAAESLGEIGDERALGPLIAALGRSSLREPVLEALGKIGNVDTLAPLIAGLADPLRIVREVSVTALSAIYRKNGQREREQIVAAVRAGMTDRAADFIEELLITSGGELQKSSVAVLGWAGRESSIQKVLALLKEEDLEEPVVQALKHVDGNRVRLLLKHLQDDNALVRRAIAKVLGETVSREAEAALIGLLADENGHVRSAAAEALGRLGSRKAVEPLLRLLEDEYESVQESAIHALADIGDDSVLDGLVKEFTAHAASLRKNIVLVVGRFSTEKAADALTFALKDEEPEVRKAVVQAFGHLGGVRAVRPLLLAITDDDPEIRMLAADALGKTNVPEAAEALLPLLEDDDLWVRAAAARGLGRIGGEKIGKTLAGYLDRAEGIFLLALVDVLGKLREERALPALLKLADHQDPEVRKTVLTALSAYGGPQVQRAVLARLSDPHWSVRKAAVDLLRERRDAAAEPLLERIAEQDPDHIVRQAAREAMGR
ncbi:MAG: HEAT repeat domain-containing protein [Nitrospirota bacterium]